jgi:type II secretory pathway component PulF
MNWKKILYFDLRGLFSSARATDETAVSAYDFWFVRIFTLFSGGRREGFSKPGRHALDTRNYRPGRYYRWIAGKRWRGPFYLSSSRWRRDLLSMVSTLAAIVRTNGSLTKGLEAAAREENRLMRRFNSVQIWALAKACAVGALFVAIGLYITFNAFEFMNTLAVLVFCSVCFVGMIVSMIVLHRSRPGEALFLALRDHLAAGRPLSEAMRGMHRFFPSFYADMVKAGEDSGRLGECLEQLCDDTVHSIKLGRVFTIFVVYLGGVFAVQCTILSFLCFKVYPVFAEIAHDFGGQLPWPARAVMSAADSLYHFPAAKTALVALAVLIVILGPPFLLRIRRRAVFTRPLMGLLAVVPGLRGLVVRQNLASIAVVVEKLLRAGVPLDQTIQSASETSINPLYRNLLVRVRARMLQGETLSDALDAESTPILVPKAFRGFVSIGERSGLLPEALARIGELYRRAVEKQLQILVDAVLPFGVIGLGFLTLIAELSLFLTLSSIYDRINVL